MNKYEHSKIYKIVNDVDDMVYVGSTIQPLNERWRKHIIDYNHRNLKSKFHQKIKQIGIDKFKIILISMYPCYSKQQLLIREREEYDKYDNNILLNKQRPIIVEENEIGKKNYDKVYRDKHKKYLYEQKKYI